MKVGDYGTQQKDTALLNEEGLHFSTIRKSTKEHMPYSAGNSYFGTVTTNKMPTFMEMHPYTWSKEDVYIWLDWCRKEYALSEVPLEKFSMNGKALCVLTKEDFKERAPNVGDVLFNTLQQFASTNLHPSFRNALPHLLPQMATSTGLLMPAAAAMCNSFIPTAHLQHFLAQAAYPTPMTPDSSPSAPSVSSSNPTPPRNVTPVNRDQKPLIVVTEPSGNSSLVSAAEVNKIPVGVLDTEPSTPSPHARSMHGSPRRSSPHGDHNGPQEAQSAEEVFKRRTSPANIDNLPHVQEHQMKQDEVKQSESHDGDQPLNLSRRPSESLPTPSPPLLTPYIKAEPPVMPGAGLQAAFRAYFPKNLPSTALANRQLLSVPRPQLSQQSNSKASSPSIPLVIQKINQSGGEMTVRHSPDPKFAVTGYSNTRPPALRDLVKEIKKEPGTESLDLSQRNHLTPQYPGQPSLVGSISKATSPVNAPHTPTYDPISPCDEDDLETPFSPPVTPGGTLLGFTPGTPNGSIPHGRPDGTGKLLWEFLSELLDDPTLHSNPKPIVRWIDMPTYTFQILDTGRLSSLWGQQKNRGTMNYEKLSRALRYYKKVGIIEKAAGKRLTYKFMKPPNSIKRGQRGARPGVPRKNRRHSFLQSQQSVNEEGNTSPRRETEEQTSSGAGDTTPFTVARMPQFMASGTLKTSLQHVVNQRAEAMRLAGLPSSVTMLAGLPLVVPSSTALHFNGALSSSVTTSANSVHANSTTQSASTSVKISPKAVTKLSELENNSNETAAKFKTVTTEGEIDCEQNILESENKRREEERERSEEEKMNNGDESAKPSDEANNNEEQKSVTENKAVHLGMPVPVPTYDPLSNGKAKSKSLSKRRLMSTGNGTVAIKFPRLILPKSTVNPETRNSNELGNVGHEEMAE